MKKDVGKGNLLRKNNVIYLLNKYNVNNMVSGRGFESSTGHQIILKNMVLEEIILIFIIAAIALILLFVFTLPFRRHFLLAIGMLVLVPPFFVFWMLAELFSFLFLEDR